MVHSTGGVRRRILFTLSGLQTFELALMILCVTAATAFFVVGMVFVIKEVRRGWASFKKNNARFSCPATAKGGSH